VFEKAGINVSVVYGQMPPEAYRAATGEGAKSDAYIPFFAAGISSVMHPWNPKAPTVHFNYRYFETDAPEGVEGAPRAWWFGGGTDLTPSYVFEEDVKHFHQTLKDVCDQHDDAFYPRFKQWCDDYFMIKVRTLTCASPFGDSCPNLAVSQSRCVGLWMLWLSTSIAASDAASVASFSMT
jgi:coproporphyrinogen III oxidase